MREYMSVSNGRLVFKGRVDLGAIEKDNDGYYYWWPKVGHGAWPSWALTAIATLLDEMNKPWDDEINVAFEADKERLGDEI